jgi:hypothetical protein
MVWASLEVNSLFENLWRALSKPNGLTSKTHSKCWMSKTGGKPGLERGLALLRRSLQGVFPRIKLTTLEIVLIKLSTTEQHNVYETYFQQIETSLQLEGSVVIPDI